MSKDILSTKSLGKLLLPDYIFSLPYKKRLGIVYERVKSERVNENMIFFIFLTSFLISFSLYLLLFDRIYFLFSDYMESISYQFLIFTLFALIINICVYFASLIALLIYYDSTLKRYEEEIEKNLPDFLDNLVSNLKGGYGLEKAMTKSVREDQKALQREVQLINEKVLSGTSVADALSDLRDRFNSAIISRTFFLIVEGLRGGGNMTKPLERISANLKKIYLLNDEVKSSVGGFTVIIKAIGGYLSPALFALAITLLIFIGDLLVLLSESEAQAVSMSEIPQEFVDYLVWFSYSIIILVSIFSNLIITHLNNEQTYRAFKSIPITILISCLIYYFLSNFLISYFSNII
ncbi:MAG: type II secretion system F family protein [Candidatus Nanoarchaeia archaeon]